MLRRTKTQGNIRITLRCIVLPKETMGIVTVSLWMEFQWQKGFSRLWQEKRAGQQLFCFSRSKAKPTSPFFTWDQLQLSTGKGPHTNHGFRTRALGGSSTETSNTLHIIQMKRCWCWRGEKHSSWHLSTWNSATVTVSGLDSRTVFLKQQEPCLLHQF